MCTLWSRFWNNRQNFSFLKQPNSSIFSRYTERTWSKVLRILKFLASVNRLLQNKLQLHQYDLGRVLFISELVSAKPCSLGVENYIFRWCVQLCIAVKSEISFLISTFSLRSTCWFIDVFSNLTCNTSSPVHFIQLPPFELDCTVLPLSINVCREQEKIMPFLIMKKCNLLRMSNEYFIH